MAVNTSGALTKLKRPTIRMIQVKLEGGYWAISFGTIIPRVMLQAGTIVSWGKNWK